VNILRYFIIFILFTIFKIDFVSSQNSVQKEVNKFINASTLENASISFLAIDLDSNTTIAEFNSRKSLPSASTAKLFATSTALKTLGKNYSPSTNLFIEGEITSDSILNGNVWIQGGGDPTLGSRFFNDEGKESSFLTVWVDTLLKLGIKTIKGRIIADGSSFSYQGVPDGWTWSDMGNYYGAGASGVSAYDNMIRYHFKTGSQAGQKTQLMSTFPLIENLNFDNQITSSNRQGDNSYIYGAPYSYDRFGTGTLPLNRTDFMVKGSLPDPELQLAIEFSNELIKRGVLISQNPIGNRKVKYDNNYKNFKLFYVHKGEKIESIVAKTNLHSVNLFAESLLYLISFEKSGFGSTENGIKEVEKCWGKDVDFKSMNLTDGSGLSRSNAISASHFCQLLQGIYKSGIYLDFSNSLPIAGCSGTLSGVCKNQLGHGRVKAKSGTLNRVKSYVGYVDSKSGKKIAFAIIVNNYNCSSSQLVDMMEHIFNSLSTF